MASLLAEAFGYGLAGLILSALIGYFASSKGYATGIRNVMIIIMILQGIVLLAAAVEQTKSADDIAVAFLGTFVLMPAFGYLFVNLIIRRQ